MESNRFFQDFLWKLSHVPMLIWAFVFLALALFLVWIPTQFTRMLAIAPGAIAVFFFYQTLFKGRV